MYNVWRDITMFPSPFPTILWRAAERMEEISYSHALRQEDVHEGPCSVRSRSFVTSVVSFNISRLISGLFRTVNSYFNFSYFLYLLFQCLFYIYIQGYSSLLLLLIVKRLTKTGTQYTCFNVLVTFYTIVVLTHAELDMFVHYLPSENNVLTGCSKISAKESYF